MKRLAKIPYQDSLYVQSGKYTHDEWFVGAESALSLLQSKAEHVRYSYSYDFRVLTQLCGKSGALCVLNVMGIYIAHP